MYREIFGKEQNFNNAENTVILRIEMKCEDEDETLSQNTQATPRGKKKKRKRFIPQESPKKYNSFIDAVLLNF